MKNLLQKNYYPTHCIVSLLFLLSFSACTKIETQPTEQVVNTEESSDLTNGWGNGVNLQPSYYNNGNVTFGWNLMKKNAKIKTVRIEIEPSVSIAQVKSWIQQANNNGFKVITTYHKSSVLGSDDVNELNAAANWWKTNYSALRASGAFTINLMNEWGSHSITNNAYATAYNNAISIVRQVYANYIIIDCPGYGQETATAASAVKGQGGVTLSDPKIVLSMHIYPNGYNQGKGHNLERSDLDDLASAGRPCMVGEFGWAPAGPVFWQDLVGYAKTKGWTVLGWAWNGDGLGMNMVNPYWGDNPRASSYTKSSYFKPVYDLL